MESQGLKDERGGGEGEGDTGTQHSKSNVQHGKRSFLRRHKSKQGLTGNGFAGLIPEYVGMGCATSLTPFTSVVNGKSLSPRADRTYNQMLQSRLNNNRSSFSRIHSKNSIQSRVYNFLERPTGWKCFIYHFTV